MWRSSWWPWWKKLSKTLSPGILNCDPKDAAHALCSWLIDRQENVLQCRRILNASCRYLSLRYSTPPHHLSMDCTSLTSLRERDRARSLLYPWEGWGELPSHKVKVGMSRVNSPIVSSPCSTPFLGVRVMRTPLPPSCLLSQAYNTVGLWGSH